MKSSATYGKGVQNPLTEESTGKEKKIKAITVNEVLDLHDQILQETGGETGILNIGNIEFTVDFVNSHSRPIRLFGVFDLSAIIVRDIIQGHPFMDGNKRTGMEVLDVFLRKNGFYLSFDSPEGIQFALAVAMNEIKIPGIKEWIHQHSRKTINNGYVIKEEAVIYMPEIEKKRKRENPYNIPEESMAIIDESIRKNKKFLEELAKY